MVIQRLTLLLNMLLKAHGVAVLVATHQVVIVLHRRSAGSSGTLVLGVVSRVLHRVAMVMSVTDALAVALRVRMLRCNSSIKSRGGCIAQWSL